MTNEKMYRIVYHGDGTNEYVEIVDYKGPTQEELIQLVSLCYANFSVALCNPRTIPVHSYMYEAMKQFVEKVDKLNITSDFIRYYQNPKFWKLPEKEKIKSENFRKKIQRKG